LQTGHEVIAIRNVVAQDYRDAMTCLGAAVNIVTTDGRAGRAGFAASAIWATWNRRGVAALWWLRSRRLKRNRFPPHG
jgi:hypothetical protein